MLINTLDFLLDANAFSLLFFNEPLLEKCPNTEFFWSVLSRIPTRKDSAFGHFSRSECYISNQEEVEEETVLEKASFLMPLKETTKNIVIGRISLNTTHSKHVAVEEKQRELARKTQTQIQTQT